jgi:membrane associated rhomboid family serine protease
MAHCACCNEILPSDAAQGELCFACIHAMEDQKSTADIPVATKQAYPVTRALLALHLAVYAVTTAISQIWGSSQLMWAALDWGPFTLSGQWWRLLTSAFVHFGAGHLVGNLVFLWILGKRSEQIFGKWRYLFVYLSCGLVGSLTSMAVHPELVSGGASAGIFGLAGCLISAYALKGLTLSRQARWKLLLLVLWTAYSVYSVHPDTKIAVDNAAHGGGLSTGLILGVLLASSFAGAPIRERRAFAGTILVLILGYISVGYYNRYAIPLKSAIRALNHNRVDDALPGVMAALQKNPDSMLANILATEIYLKKRDYSNADLAIHRALIIDAKDEYAIYLMGLVKLHTGHCNEAHDIATRLGEYGTEGWSLFTAPCDMAGSGDRAFSEGKLAFAQSLYNLALHQNPNDYRAEIGLAKTYSARGMNKEAEEANAKAAQMQAASSGK